MLVDNHIFSKDKTNLEIIKEVNAKIIDESIINATNIDGLLQFVYDLFSGETDKDSYKLLKTFKILFQVDDDITTGNTNLSFNKKILKINKTTLSFELGDWSTNGKTENGRLNTFLSWTFDFDGVIKGLASEIHPDGRILDFLNSIGIGSEQLGGVASELVSSILTGIDMDNFFKTLVNKLV